MAVHPIHRWGIPSGYCTKRLWHSPVLSSPSAREFVGRFLLIHFSESLYVFFEPGLSWEIVVPSIITLLSTVVAGDVVQISPGSLLLIFSVTFIVPSFIALRKHELVADPVGLRISMRVITRLIL